MYQKLNILKSLLIAVHKAFRYFLNLHETNLYQHAPSGVPICPTLWGSLEAAA